MHNKFCVFDSSVVFTGSMNPTGNDNYRNNNNIVVIKSKALAANYLDEFMELKNGIYGKGSKVKNPVIYIGNIKVENYFCPEDSCKLHAINALKVANRSIYFMDFSFTDEDIGNLLWNKDYLGLDVKGIFEVKQVSEFSRYEDLKKFAILDTNKYTMHHKVFIIDNETVVTGSYNPTENANENNDENMLIIHDKAVAAKYVVEFNKLFYHVEKLPETTGDLIISRLQYDPSGNDNQKEFIELKNLGSDVIILDYYSISDNKSNMQLSGNLAPNSSIRIQPKFSLRNKNGMLLLKHNADVVDYVFWEGVWGLMAAENEILIRINNLEISENAWMTAHQ